MGLTVILCAAAVLVFAVSAEEEDHAGHMGCWRDTGNRAMPVRIHQGELNRHGGDKVEKCRAAVRARGWRVFGVQYGGECWSGPDAHNGFKKYGRANNCRGGTGGGWANDVYSTGGGGGGGPPRGGAGGKPRHIGCWRDTGNRAMPVRLQPVGGGDKVQRCHRAAAQRGWRTFGVQYGGECWSGPDAHRGYRKYGRANNCRGGTGGGWANDVYQY